MTKYQLNTNKNRHPFFVSIQFHIGNLTIRSKCLNKIYYEINNYFIKNTKLKEKKSNS